jgi:hypothetical protein
MVDHGCDNGISKDDDGAAAAGFDDDNDDDYGRSRQCEEVDEEGSDGKKEKEMDR